MAIFYGQTFINVKGRGALGDGSTNDRAALRDAIADLPPTGGVLVFPPGTYLINSTSGQPGLDFESLSNFQILAYGATLKAASGMSVKPGNTLIAFTNCSNFSIYGLTVDGNRAQRSPEEVYAHSISLGNCSHFSFYDVDSLNAPVDGYYLYASNDQIRSTFCRDGLFSNCRADNCYRQGMSIINGSNLQIIGGSFTNSSGTSPECGINVEADNTTSSGGAPVNDNILIQGVTVSGCHGNGINTSGQKNVGIVLNKCDISRCDGAVGVFGETTITDCYIHDISTCTGNGIINVGAAGGFNYHSTIKGNRFNEIRVNKPCVYTHSTARYITICDNQANAIYYFAAAIAPHTKINNNTILSCSGGPVFAIQGANCEVSSNNVEKYITIGVSCDAAEGVTHIHHNIFESGTDLDGGWGAIRANFGTGSTVVVESNTFRQAAAGSNVAIRNATSGGANVIARNNLLINFPVNPFAGGDIYLEHTGSGNPNGVISASLSSQWRDNSGGIFYVRQSGGATSWTAK